MYTYGERLEAFWQECFHFNFVVKIKADTRSSKMENFCCWWWWWWWWWWCKGGLEGGVTLSTWQAGQSTSLVGVRSGKLHPWKPLQGEGVGNVAKRVRLMQHIHFEQRGTIRAMVLWSGIDPMLT